MRARQLHDFLDERGKVIMQGITKPMWRPASEEEAIQWLFFNANRGHCQTGYGAHRRLVFQTSVRNRLWFRPRRRGASDWLWCVEHRITCLLWSGALRQECYLVFQPMLNDTFSSIPRTPEWCTGLDMWCLRIDDQASMAAFTSLMACPALGYPISAKELGRLPNIYNHFRRASRCSDRPALSKSRPTRKGHRRAKCFPLSHGA